MFSFTCFFGSCLSLPAPDTSQSLSLAAPPNTLESYCDEEEKEIAEQRSEWSPMGTALAFFELYQLEQTQMEEFLTQHYGTFAERILHRLRKTTAGTAGRKRKL